MKYINPFSIFVFFWFWGGIYLVLFMKYQFNIKGGGADLDFLVSFVPKLLYLSLLISIISFFVFPKWMAKNKTLSILMLLIGTLPFWVRFL